MFNYLNQIKIQIVQITIKTFENLNADEVSKNIRVEFPENLEFGDLTTNVALILARSLKKSPAQVATILMDLFVKEIECLQSANVISGFINFKLNENAWLDLVQSILDSGMLYGSAPKKHEKNYVNLEFCSANPTGPIHLGHIRGAVMGEAIANLLKFAGYKVDKEYYINDSGGQIETLLRSTFLRYKELFGEKIDLSSGLYPGAYLINIACELRDKFGDSLLNMTEKQVIEITYEQVFESIMNIIQSDLLLLDIKFDLYTRESHIVYLLDDVLKELEKKNLLYMGLLEKPKGSSSDDWEEREQLLFRSTCFGDDVDRAMKRSSGEWTYFAKDCAYHLHKIKRQYDRLILQVGIDHIGYQKRMRSCVEALSDCATKFDFTYHNMVYLTNDGKQLKMSKRSGNLIGAQEMIDAVGVGVLKFFLLSKRHDMELDFDIAKAKESTKDNPYFYIQYAYVRCNSIKNNSAEVKMNIDEGQKINYTINQHEKKLLQHLLFWPVCIQIAVSELEPHRVNFYLQELAGFFHSWWNLGNGDLSARIICMDNLHATKFRLKIVESIMNIINIGMRLIAVEVLEKM